MRPDVLALRRGGPISTPKDAAQVLARARGCHGFYSAISMERLPAEQALTEQTRRFKALSLRAEARRNGAVQGQPGLYRTLQSTNGTVSYEIGNTHDNGATVYQANKDWTDPVILFDTPGGTGLGGSGLNGIA